jgi:hypothetical protein
VRENPVVCGSVGVANGYGVGTDESRVRFPGKAGHTSPQRPDQFWGPLQPLLQWAWSLFSIDMKLIIYLQLVQRLTCGTLSPLPHMSQCQALN